MKYIVKDHPGLFRDPRSKAIINEDKKGYNRYLLDKSLKEKNEQLEKDINNMRNDINDIKSLLVELLNKK